MKKVLLCAPLMILFLSAAAAQPAIKKVPVQPTPASSGSEMFTTYCAVCHGPDGKGAGPAAAALKKSPGDLTVLAKNHGGKFPSARVYTVITGDGDISAHGSKDMPVWGALFASLEHGNQPAVEMRINNLTNYIKKMQAQ